MEHAYCVVGGKCGPGPPHLDLLTPGASFVYTFQCKKVIYQLISLAPIYFSISTVCLNAAISPSRLWCPSPVPPPLSCAAFAGATASRSSILMSLVAWGGCRGAGAEVGGVSTVPEGERGSVRGGVEPGGAVPGGSEEDRSRWGENISTGPSRVACCARAHGSRDGGRVGCTGRASCGDSSPHATARLA